jgi:hypothetical protein
LALLRGVDRDAVLRLAVLAAGLGRFAALVRLAVREGLAAARFEVFFFELARFAVFLPAGARLADFRVADARLATARFAPARFVVLRCARFATFPPG